MPLPTRPLANLLLCLVLAAAATVFLYLMGRQSGVSGVQWGSSPRLVQLINVHESSTTWLSINGKKYDNVIGSSPYHIEIPQIGAVFFVTSNQGQTQYVYHFVTLKDGREIAITTKHTYIGLGIGTRNTSPIHTSLVSAKWPKIELAHHVESAVTKFEFDLDKQTVISTGPARDP